MFSSIHFARILQWIEYIIGLGGTWDILEKTYKTRKKRRQQVTKLYILYIIWLIYIMSTVFNINLFVVWWTSCLLETLETVDVIKAVNDFAESHLHNTVLRWQWWIIMDGLSLSKNKKLNLCLPSRKNENQGLKWGIIV